MLVKVEGIVLSETPYSESSKILNIITREYGVIGVLSKGCKSLKSPLRSVSSKLTYGYFNIQYKKDKLSILISVDIIDNLKNIKKDLSLKNLSYSYFILELTEQVIKHNYNNNIFDIMIASILKINENFDPLVITNILQLKYLDYLGVMPVLNECASCGSKTSIATLSSSKGGLICNRCRQNEKIVDSKTIKLIRMFYYVDIKKITNLDISSKIKLEINSFLDEYYDLYTGLYLKSKRFIEDINNVN